MTHTRTRLTVALTLCAAMAGLTPAAAAKHTGFVTFTLPFEVDLDLKFGPLPRGATQRTRWLADSSTAVEPTDRAVERCMETVDIGSSSATARELDERATVCETLCRFHEGNDLGINAEEYRRQAINHRRLRSAHRAHAIDDPSTDDKRNRLYLAIDLAAVGRIEEAHEEMVGVLAWLDIREDQELAADVALITAQMAHEAQQRGQLALADRYLTHARDMLVTEGYILADELEDGRRADRVPTGRRHYLDPNLQDLIVVLDVKQSLTHALNGDGRHEAATYAPIAGELIAVLEETRNPEAGDAAVLMAVFACCLATGDIDYVSSLLTKLEGRCEIPDQGLLRAHNAAAELACEPGIPGDTAFLAYNALVGHKGRRHVPVHEVFLAMSVDLERPDVLHLHDAAPIELGDLEDRYESALAREYGAGIRVVVVPMTPLLADASRRSDQVPVSFVELPDGHPDAGTSSEELIQAITATLVSSLADYDRGPEMRPARVRIGRRLPDEPTLEDHRIPLLLAVEILADLNDERPHDIVELADLPARRNARRQPEVEAFTVLAQLLNAGQEPLAADWTRPARTWEAMANGHLAATAAGAADPRDAEVAIQVTLNNVFAATTQAIEQVEEDHPARRGEIVQSLDAAFFAGNRGPVDRVLRDLDGLQRHRLLWKYLHAADLGLGLPRWDLIEDLHSKAGLAVALRWLEQATEDLDHLLTTAAQDIEDGQLDIDALGEALRSTQIAADYVVAVSDLLLTGALDGEARVATLATIVGMLSVHEANPKVAIRGLRDQVADSDVAMVDRELYALLTLLAMRGESGERAALHELNATMSAKAVLYRWAFADQAVVGARMDDLAPVMDDVCHDGGDRRACKAAIRDLDGLIQAALDDELRAEGYKMAARAHIALGQGDEALRALADFAVAVLQPELQAPGCHEYEICVRVNTAPGVLDDAEWAALEMEKLLAAKPVGLQSRLETRLHLDWKRATALYSATVAIADSDPDVARGAAIAALALLSRDASTEAVIDPTMAGDACLCLAALRALGVQEAGETACPAWRTPNGAPQALTCKGNP